MAGKEDYKRMVHKKWLFIVLCIGLIFVSLILSLSVGMYDISFVDS